MASVARAEPGEGSGRGGAPAPSALGALWLAARPRTLPLAAAPVLVGTAVAHAGGGARWDAALAALAGALWLQIGANFANDVGDAARGADGAARVGPPRAVASGWLAPRAMRAAAGAAFALAALCGAHLVTLAGWPIALLGALSILAGLAYTSGPWPLGYHGLGDLAVFLFFGVAAVCGTAYVQTLAIPGDALLASLPVGALAAAVLGVNNLRDAEGDRAAGKRTLAVRFGARAARRAYAALVGGAFAVVIAWAALAARPALLLPLLCAAPGRRLVVSVGRDAGAALNEALAGTARLALAFAALLAAGIALAP